jgi:hypothetical protein
MSTEGTPDPALEPEQPVGGDAAAAAEPAPPAPETPASSYPPPGYAQAPSEQPGPAGAYEQQPGYQAPPPGSGYQQPGYQQPYGAPVPLSPSDERLWATLAHIGPVLTSFVAPLLIWLVFRERSRFVDDQGKEALNFQIFLAIVYVVGVITAVFVIGIFILLAGWILAIVFGIQGAIAANRGELYRYPLTWRVIK